LDAFGYLSVLLSIIVGIGLTQILTASGRLIQHRQFVRFYWPPLVWAALLVVIYVQTWWAMFGLREQANWTFLGFLVVLAQTVTLYMMAALVLPEEVGDRGVDLRTHYERQSRWFFSFLLATLLVSISKDLVLSGQLPRPENLAFHIFLVAACISAIVIRRPRFHEWFAVLGTVSIAVYIAALFTRLR
jgi:hypothetical protein